MQGHRVHKIVEVDGCKGILFVHQYLGKGLKENPGTVDEDIPVLHVGRKKRLGFFLQRGIAEGTMAIAFPVTQFLVAARINQTVFADGHGPEDVSVGRGMHQPGGTVVFEQSRAVGHIQGAVFPLCYGPVLARGPILGLAETPHFRCMSFHAPKHLRENHPKQHPHHP